MRLSIAIAAMILNGAWAQVVQPPAQARTTLGIEGTLHFEFSGPPLQARPRTEDQDLMVRIVEIRPGNPTENTSHYELAFLSTRTGRFDLRDELVTLDEQTPGAVGLDPLWVQVDAILPPRPPGDLFGKAASDDGLGMGVKPWVWMVVVGVIWILPMIWWAARRNRGTKQSPNAPKVTDLGLANQLRPLVRDAASGKLSAAGKARLERLLISYWRERTALTSSSAGDSLAQLRRHAEAGPLLGRLETWLHAPPTKAVSEAEIESLLSPYANADSQETAAEGALP